MTAGDTQLGKSATARELRKLRARRLGLRLMFGIVVPTIWMAIYSGFVATPQYESVTVFTVQSAEPPSGGGGALQLLAGMPGAAVRDTLLVRDFIESRDLAEQLERDLAIREHYGDPCVDLFSRLGAEATIDETHEYLLDRVTIELDPLSGAITLSVRAFSAEYAERLGQAILDASERVVNEMNERMQHDRLQFANQLVTESEARLARAREALAQLQSGGSELDPYASAQGILGLRTQLEGELALARSELAILSVTLQPTAPEVLLKRRRIAALQQQITEQTQRLASDSEHGLSETIARFEPVAAEKEIAQQIYASALVSLEVARVEAARQHRYLVRLAGPSRPDLPAYPIWWRDALAVLLVSFALLGIGTLILASIREHANV